MSTGVCNLGSINLVKFCDKEGNFNFTKFIDTITIAIRFLDNINDISNVPLPEYKKSMIEKRRVGLGVMGLGSLHYMMCIKYGSEESLRMVRDIYKIKAETELLTSALLGEEKGSFELFESKEYFNSHWWKNLEISKDIKMLIETIGQMRNSCHSANAPNGNTSIFAGVVSGGIEPVYKRDYTRWVIVTDSVKKKLIDKGFKIPDVMAGEWFETEELKFKDVFGEQILEGTWEDIDYRVDKNRGLTEAIEIRDYGWNWVKENVFDADEERTWELLNMEEDTFATIEELSVNNHIDVLKIVAHYTNMNSSKTVNIPNEYGYEDFKNLYLSAWKAGIKGLTTYRANTMIAVLEEQKTQEYQTELEEMFIKSNGYVIKKDVKLPKEYYSKGYIRKDKDKKKWYINIAFADSRYMKPYAMFIHTNSKESTEVAGKVIEDMELLCRTKGIKEELIEKQHIKYAGQSNVNKISRAIGLALRHNVSVVEIVNVLEDNPDGFSTLLFHIKKLLSKFIKDGTKIENEKCPECDTNNIIYQEGCKMCLGCGWSACG